MTFPTTHHYQPLSPWFSAQCPTSSQTMLRLPEELERLRNRFPLLQGQFQEDSLDCGDPNLISGFRGKAQLAIVRSGSPAWRTPRKTPDHPTGKKGHWILLLLFIHRFLKCNEISKEITQSVLELETLFPPKAPTLTNLPSPPQLLILLRRQKGSSSPLRLFLTCYRKQENRNEDFGHHHGNRQSLWLPLTHAPPAPPSLPPLSHISS